MRFAGKTAVVTGGASGIGKSTVELFLAEGAQVVMGDLDAEAGTKMVSAHPGTLHFKRCDVRADRDIKALMDFAAEATGGIDIVFNNAGAGGARGGIDEITAEEWDDTMALLLRSVALGIRHATPHLKARGGGAIVNTSSVSALQSGYAPTAYSVAKAGVLHLTRIAAADLAQYGIRVNAVCPGFIVTNIFNPAFDPAIDALQAKQILMGAAAHAQPVARAGQPRDIAEAVAYLASDAASFVTGTDLLVDGGMLIGTRASWDPATPGLIDMLAARA
ncbi:SDR family NAD(P)-dependent oxidoreductase [Sphingomonas sp. C3-2]|uniref:SDR family NAD(P)-dependent oxidoreductase n=1 Tax=Sphingomonas sp. C3-2 TaxID=3062169 RepID=UPI00294AA1C4|nr:SDR family NAD(P)-dependent oxidoreductase [Sphingomonas sp. C3-2]WOK35867.1 SDR family NAD(P)-dependent oxidoreductase [Sphingomonas sp. C3-2]